MRLSAYKTYMARVSDPPIFVTQLVGSNTSFATQQIADQLRGLIVSRFSEALAEAPVSILLLAAQYTELAARRAVLMQPDLARLGLELTQLVSSLRSAPSIPAVTHATTTSRAPPPIPQPRAVYLAIDGQQQGPYSAVELGLKAADCLRTRDTLVWADGMADWMAAERVPGVAARFAAV